MRSLDTRGVLAAQSALTALDPPARRRADAAIRAAAGTVDAHGWGVGIFDARGSLVAFDLSAPGSERAALALLHLVPLPESPGVVRLKATPRPRPNEKLPLALGTALRFDDDHSLALVLLRPQRAEHVWTREAETIQRSARQIGRVFAGVAAWIGQPDAAAPRGHAEGFFLLTKDLDVSLEWHAENAPPETLAALVQSHAHRLPFFLERTVRSLIASWNFARIGTCLSGTAHPIVGLTVRVVPMRKGDQVMVGVFLERSADAHHMDVTASQFRISPREREVLHGMLEGQSVAEIAGSLNLAESTINDHIARMIAKTNSRNRTEMAATLLGWPSIKRNGSAKKKSAQPHANPPRPESPTRCSWRYNVGADASRSEDD